MKVRVLKEFYHIANKGLREVGTEFECDEKEMNRLNSELNKQSEGVYLEKIEDKTVNYSKMTKAELQAILNEKGIEFDKDATNKDLVALIEAEVKTEE